MLLKQKIKTSMIEAMKNKDQVRLSLLRLMLTFITNKEIDLGIKGKSDLSDSEAVNVLRSMVKSRENVILEYQKINDMEAVNREQQEINVINEFLPTPYSEQETETIVAQLIQEVGATSIRDMKKVMQVVQAREDAVRFNRSLIVQIFKNRFSS